VIGDGEQPPFARHALELVTPTRLGWAVKRRQESVTHSFDLAPTVGSQLIAHKHLVALEQLAPAAVAELGGARG
jgi:hypothetical protein